ncbi:unnamed protein product [Clavelina lepadiformis]|uniref:Uncharacterized protein n=1 Tax=Clavelina lepadiformis TaxID=159417 RepID=A0ABP0GVN4_CLALP
MGWKIDCSDDFTILDGGNQRVVTDITLFANSWKTSSSCAEAGSEPFCVWGPSAIHEERLLTG